MYTRRNVFLGSIFIITGFLVFAVNVNLISVNEIFADFWPVLFVIVPGLIMHLAYFSRIVPVGILVPGGILLFTGIVLQVSGSFNMWDVMWPGYMMSVALGLFELYLFGAREKGLLIPVSILGGLSLIFYSFTLGDFIGSEYRNYIVSFILIVSGIFLIFKGGLGKKGR